MKQTGQASLRLRLLAQIEWPAGMAWLAPGERERLASLGSERRRQTFLAGRWLLRELLADVQGGGAPQTQSAEIDAEGRSHVAVGHANLSHSGDWCVAVWSEAPVGVDLEVLRPRADLMAIAERVASQRECAQLAATHDGPERLQAFYRLWTLKEAALKSTGQGLDFARMRGLEFEPVPADGMAACTPLPRAGLQLAVCCTAALGELPGQAAGMPLAWQRLRVLTP